MPDGDRPDDDFAKAATDLRKAMETCPQGHEFRTIKRYTSHLSQSAQALVIAGYDAGVRARPAAAPAAPAAAAGSWAGRLFWWCLDVLKRFLIPGSG